MTQTYLHRRVRASSLHQTTDGAILVIGLVMGLLLVGALWHIVSVGDAILWREHLQDAADAAAFENAVWNARGMNVLVFLNMVMAGLMAIIIAMRGAVILMTALVTALLAARAACLFPATPITIFLCGISSFAGTAQSILQRVTQFEQQNAPRVRRAIEGVQKAQVVVATVTPIIGVAESSLRTWSAYDAQAFSLSASLLPTSTGEGAIVDRRRPQNPAFDPPQLRDEVPRIGRGVSLPASLDTTWMLCQKAGEFIPNELLALLDTVGLPDSVLDGAGGFFRDLAGQIAGSMPTVFCGDRSLSDISELTDLFADIAREDCRGAREAGRVTNHSSHTPEQRRTLEQYDRYWREGFIAHPNGDVERGYVFDTERCERERLNQVNNDYHADRGLKPLRVFRYAEHGNFLLQSWGFAHREATRVEADDRAISFPAPGQAAALAARPYELGTAQAEIYWDTGAGSGCEHDQTWSTCQPEAMWLMRWKARLRRVHNPAEMAGRALATAAASELVNGVLLLIDLSSQRLEALVGNWLRGTRGEQVANFLRGNLNEAFNVLNPFGWSGHLNNFAEGTVGEWLAHDPPPPEQSIIH